MVVLKVKQPREVPVVLLVSPVSVAKPTDLGSTSAKLSGPDLRAVAMDNTFSGLHCGCTEMLKVLSIVGFALQGS
jgi:hypothetical protein